MMPATLDLSVIIVNWNSAEYARKCLQSVYAHTTGVSFEVIVVDNASFDGVDQIIASQFADVRFVQLHENKGFGAANNAGFAIASGRVACFLNPDTEITGNVLAAMVEQLRKDEGIGAAGCRLLNSDLSLQTSCVLPFPTIVNQLLDVEWLKRRTPRWGLWGTRALFSRGPWPQNVEALSGAFMVVPRGVFEKVNGFCEEYFMYSEDVDLCYKIWHAGYSVAYYGGQEIIHHGGKSSKRVKESRFETVMTREAIARYFAKHKSVAYSRTYKKLVLIAAMVRLIAIVVATPFLVLKHPRNEVASMMSKWLWVMRWSVGFKRGSLTA